MSQYIKADNDHSDGLATGGTVRPIVSWDDPIMHIQTKPVTVFDDELRDLVRDMFATLFAAEGVGLAAPQVGVDLALYVYECPDDDMVIHRGIFCNPEVELPSGRDRVLDAAEEGCLSWPGAYQSLARPNTAICRGQDVHGDPIEIRGTGLLARCLQHETDHLHGTVFGDRLSNRARKLLDEQKVHLEPFYPDDWPVTPKGRRD